MLEEAHNAHKLRQMAPAAKLKEQGFDPKDKRDLLTVEDLVKALGEVRALIGLWALGSKRGARARVLGVLALNVGAGGCCAPAADLRAARLLPPAARREAGPGAVLRNSQAPVTAQ